MLDITSKSFVIKSDRFIGTADLSQVVNVPDWFYFNRLFVPSPIRGQGIAKDLLERVVIWADESEVNICLSVNPYGDVGFDDLVKLYSRYGFVSVGPVDGIMVRMANNKPIPCLEFFESIFDFDLTAPIDYGSLIHLTDDMEES